jgi:hypothetical protein
MTVNRIERLRINVIADVYSLEDPSSVWETFIPYEEERPLIPVPLERDAYAEKGLNPSGTVLHFS